jgi:ElaB/YqjD/DUF883 family membrane-anchored ribosome-binding protein
MVHGRERSVDELKRTATQSRAEFAGTVEQLRSKASATATELRARISPDAIKGDVSAYFQTKGEALIEKAKENPLQTAAIGAMLAYPLMGIVKAIPAPVLMIGAGLFLLGTSSGQKMSRQMSDIGNDLLAQASDKVDAARRSVNDSRDAASAVIADASRVTRDAVDDLRNKSASVADVFSTGVAGVKGAASNIAQSVTDSVNGLKAKASDGTSGSNKQSLGSVSDGMQTIGEAAAALAIPSAAQLRKKAAASSQQVVTLLNETIQQNPLVVGGIGLAIGILLASALPRTQVEGALLGEASSDLKKRVRDTASQGYETAKESAGDLGRRVRKVAENAVTTALELPTQSTDDAA